MYATIKNKKIYYETGGKGKDWMVFVHGWGGTHKSLKKLAEQASGKYQTLILDLPGFGLSENPPPEWGVEEYAAVVLDLLQELQIDKAIYFGHSFGGSLGIWIAAKQPKTLVRLILCASSFKRTGKTSSKAVMMNKFVTTYLPFFAGLMNKTKPLIYKIFFRNSDLAKFPHLETNFRKVIMHDLTPLVSQIAVPTLLLWGERDTYTPVELVDELEAKIPGAKKVIFPFKNHNLPIRYSDDVWKEIKLWLR